MCCYDVFLGDEPIGKVNVSNEGLYTKFRCCCRLATEGIYRLHICADGNQKSLGVLIPEGDYFVLERKIASKLIGEQQLSFYISSDSGENQKELIILDPDNPFLYIANLRSAHFKRLNDNLCGIYFE